MALNRMNQEFQRRIKEGIDTEAIEKAHIKRVRQSLARHKYGVPSQRTRKDIDNGR